MKIIRISFNLDVLKLGRNITSLHEVLETEGVDKYRYIGELFKLRGSIDIS